MMNLVFHFRQTKIKICFSFQASAIRRHISQSLRQRKGHFPCYYINEFATYTLPPGKNYKISTWQDSFDKISLY
jgi:hypothetical protein